jgi:hypothetical protein
MAKYTSKLNLKKPEANDFYNVNDSNENFDKIDEFASRTDNPHNVTKAQVGLGNVDNTSDKNKPISTAQATAINEAKSIGTSANTKIDNHNANKSNPHNVTSEQIGALPLVGGVISGSTLGMGSGHGQVYCNDNTINIFSMDAPNKNAGRYLGVYNNKNAVHDSVILTELAENGSNNSYRIYGEHNLPYPAQIQTGSYVGTGLYGSANPCRLEFSFVPKYVLIEAYYDHVLGNIASPTDYRLELFNGVTETVSHSFRDGKDVQITTMKVSWMGNTVEWYWKTTSNTTNAEYHQLNGAITYRYIAIG